MKRIARLISQNYIFFVVYKLLLLIVMIFIFNTTQEELHIYCNQFHTAFFDIFFKNITHLGDGIITPLTALVLIFFSFRKSFIFLAGNLSATGFAQILKNFLFEDQARPFKFFYYSSDYKPYYVPGIELPHSFSFPSGHSTSAFASFLFFAFISKNNYLKLFFLLCAVITAYSRVYLSFHFVEDITAGSIIGVFFMTIFYIILSPEKISKLDSKLNLKFKIVKPEF